MSITKAPGGLGKLTIQRRGNSYQALVRSDNGFGDDNHLTGLPFGYQVLPSLRAQIRPIYARLGVIPEVAAGLETAAELTAPPRD